MKSERERGRKREKEGEKEEGRKAEGKGRETGKEGRERRRRGGGSLSSIRRHLSGSPARRTARANRPPPPPPPRWAGRQAGRAGCHQAGHRKALLGVELLLPGLSPTALSDLSPEVSQSSKVSPATQRSLGPSCRTASRHPSSLAARPAVRAQHHSKEKGGVGISRTGTDQPLPTSPESEEQPHGAAMMGSTWRVSDQPA